jgi:hypothetical protein
VENREIAFEDQEGHQAQSASTILIQWVSIRCSRHLVEHADGTPEMLWREEG